MQHEYHDYNCLLHVTRPTDVTRCDADDVVNLAILHKTKGQGFDISLDPFQVEDLINALSSVLVWKPNDVLECVDNPGGRYIVVDDDTVVYSKNDVAQVIHVSAQDKSLMELYPRDRFRKVN